MAGSVDHPQNFCVVATKHGGQSPSFPAEDIDSEERAIFRNLRVTRRQRRGRQASSRPSRDAGRTKSGTTALRISNGGVGHTHVAFDP